MKREGATEEEEEEELKWGQLKTRRERERNLIKSADQKQQGKREFKPHVCKVSA